MQTYTSRQLSQHIFGLMLMLALWALALPFALNVPKLVQAFETGPPIGTDSSTDPEIPSAPALDQGAGSGASYNWAGYAAIGSFSGVSGSWNVPDVESSRTIASDATWVGIGGMVHRDLIQAGTQSSIENGGVTYHAWYEILPESMTYVPLAVHAGDTVAASLTEDTADVWQIVIANVTSGKSFEKQISYHSSRSSAEWVEERPSLESGSLLPLPNIGTITWKNTYAIENGTPVTPQEAGAKPISMYSRDGAVLAEPSEIEANGSEFAVTGMGNRAVAVAPPELSRITPMPIPLLIPGDISIPQTSYAIYTPGSHGSYEMWVSGKLVEEK